MARKLHFRQLLVLILASVHDVSQKEISARSKSAFGSVSKYLRLRHRDISEEIFQKLLAAIPCKEAEVLAVTACLEALRDMKEAEDLTDADLKEIEAGMLLASRLIRDALIQGLRRARSKPEPGYPQPADLAAHRFRAGEQLDRLKAIPAEHRLEAVRLAPEFQTWALCERVCEESTRQAARDIEEALAWARLAQEIAGLVEGPEGWVQRLQGYALAHVANAIRVAGDLVTSEATLEKAKRLWDNGTDANSVLDPARILDLEASLRRAQRQFQEALYLLDKALAVGRNLGRILINKGFTLEVMGEYEQAVTVLTRASSLVDKSDGRLRSHLRLNLANNFCHLGLFPEALQLVREVQPRVAERGDTIDLIRILWLEGRIAAGSGNSLEALKLLAEARRRFASHGMSYDVALALMEETVLLLEQGRITEVKALAQELVLVFQSNRVHREAQAALRLVQEAAETERATVELARDILSYLYQARYDQGLPFKVVTP